MNGSRVRLILTTVGFEHSGARSLRAGIRAAADAGLDVEWRRMTVDAFCAADSRDAVHDALRDAHVLLTVTADPRVVGLLRDLLPLYPSLGFLPLLSGSEELADLLRVGRADGSDRPALSAVAGAAARAGIPLSPRMSLLCRMAEEIAHLVPERYGDLRAALLTLHALRNASEANCRTALITLARVCAVGGSALDDPGVPVPHPRHALWTPESGVVDVLTAEPERDALTTAARLSSRPVVIVACSRNDVCSGNDAHLHALFSSLQDRGLHPLGWFGDTAHFSHTMSSLLSRIALWVNTRNFTLTGVHGSPEIDEGAELLAAVGVPSLTVLTVSSQSIDEWRSSRAGITATAVAMQVAIPEIQGGIAPLVIAGRDPGTDATVPLLEQIERVAEMASRWVCLAAVPASERRIAIVMVSHAADKGKIGAAASLDVWDSLHRLLLALSDAGYAVDVPEDADALFTAVADRTDGAPHPRVLDRFAVSDYARGNPVLSRIMRTWQSPPGEFDNDGASFEVYGARFGNITVGFQPSRGYGADPAGLLYADEASPTHAFAAFYRWLSERERPHVLLHFGTHGALEFMPGKQVGLAPDDYSLVLSDTHPHVYLYVASNPSEAAIAKRRSAATIVNHLSPPLSDAGLNVHLQAIRDDIAACLAAHDDARRRVLLAQIVEAAERHGLDADADPELARTAPESYLTRLASVLDETAESLISLGLHRVGHGLEQEETAAILRAACERDQDDAGLRSLADHGGFVDALVDEAVLGRRNDVPPEPPPGVPADEAARWREFVADLRDRLMDNDELGALIRALGGSFVRPGPGGDPIREPGVLPTGRNTFSVDPSTIPGPRAVRRGRELVEAMLEKLGAEDGSSSGADGWPESVALVLWGIETVKSRGESLAQAFALIGVEPTADSHGRVKNFTIIPSHDLGRPRIDVVVTASGVFRDMFGQAIDLLDRAVRAVAQLDEPDELNLVRKHARAQAELLGISLEDAATRVFASSPGDYGSGVNHLVLESAWEEREELSDLFMHRQCHAYGSPNGTRALDLYRQALSTVDVTWQNIDSAERSLADSDHYFEYLGGLSTAVAASSGRTPVVLVCDAYASRPTVRGIEEAMRHESRTRLLNPRWFEAMLEHGFQGVREVADRLDNTFGWSATVDAVDDATYSRIAETFVFDAGLRDRMTRLNPAAVASMANRLIEADERGFWAASDDERELLESIGDRLDDAVEGVASPNPSAADRTP